VFSQEGDAKEKDKERKKGLASAHCVALKAIKILNSQSRATTPLGSPFSISF
jgi:hypothetical protein